MTFHSALSRRKGFKVGAGHLDVAWLGVLAASTGFPAFDAPPWTQRIVILIALLGFPVSLVFAWAFGAMPYGIECDDGGHRSGGDNSDLGDRATARATARRRLVACIGKGTVFFALMALGDFAVDKFVLAPRRDASLMATAIAQQGVIDGARTARPVANSIAVLRIDPARDTLRTDAHFQTLLDEAARAQKAKGVNAAGAQK